MSSTPIARDNLITAEQFNELVTSYNKLWGDAYPLDNMGSSTALFANIETDWLAHSYGWGQVKAQPTVSPTEQIESRHTNQLIAQMNAGLYHYDDDAVLMSHFGKVPIYANIITSVITGKIAAMDAPAQAIVPATDNTDEIQATLPLRFSSNNIDSDIDLAAVSDNLTPIWDTDVHSVAKATFADYKEARYFFNSGGKLSVNLDADGGNYGSNSWDGIFLAVGEIFVSAIDVTNNGRNVGISEGGFYSITADGVYNELFKVTGYATMGEYGGYGGYGGYSEYSNRRISVSLRAVDGPTFDVYIKVTLTDDVTSGIINTMLTADYGYVNQNTTPGQTYLDSGSNVAFFTAANTVYQFIQKPIPEITICTSWTTNVPDMNTVCVDVESLAYTVPGYIDPGYTADGYTYLGYTDPEYTYSGYTE